MSDPLPASLSHKALRPAPSSIGKTAEEVSENDTALEEASADNRALYKHPTRRPAELEVRPVDEEEYEVYRMLTDLREPYRIPPRYMASTKRWHAPDIPEVPLIVFINSRSGGRAGPKLTEVLYHALGHVQVFELDSYRPGPVLQQIWTNFDEAVRAGDLLAEHIRSKLRILAAGGDGTVAWILKTIDELRLQPQPQVAVMPLGTGNDLSLSFGWGNTFLRVWIDKHETVYETLKRVGDGDPRDLDNWDVTLSCAEPGMFSQLPHSLAPVVEGDTTQVEGLFWNYFSIGLDAQAAHGFHSLREHKPWATPTRLINQAWYGYFSCTSGWFFPGCSPPIHSIATLQVRKDGDVWTDVKIPHSVRALVILNLQSYGGGRDLWGLRCDTKEDRAKGWSQPIFNDGLFEVVGLKSGWHSAVVMAGVFPRIHAKRLAQARDLRILLRATGPTTDDHGVTYMQIDGEPWKQRVPGPKSQPLVVTVRHHGSSQMLFNRVPLKGIAPRVGALVKRQEEVSLITQQSLNAHKAVTPRPETPKDRLAQMRALENALPPNALFRNGSASTFDGIIIAEESEEIDVSKMQKRVTT